MEDNVCTYCGAMVEIQREHVIPAVYYVLRSYDRSRQWIVPSCRTCNSFASSKLFFSIPEKAAYIARRYRLKFKRLISTPMWHDEELKDMGYLLRKGIEQGMMTRLFILRRIAHLETVRDYARDFLRPKWVEEEYKILMEEMAKRARKKRKVRRAATSAKT